MKVNHSRAVEVPIMMAAVAVSVDANGVSDNAKLRYLYGQYIYIR